MKYPAHTYDPDRAIEEFDVWITPSLGQIKDAEAFKVFFTEAKQGFEELDALLSGFASIEDVRPNSIVNAFMKTFNQAGVQQRAQRLFSLLLMFTGQTDNNLKCQLPVYLAQTLGNEEYPAVRRGEVSYGAIPRKITSADLAKTIGSLSGHTELQRSLLDIYLHMVLSNESDIRQFWSMCLSCRNAVSAGYGDDFLTTMVVHFKRGSITATSGHKPENLLRERMREWGMIPDYDFNTDDVSVESLLGLQVDKNKKERKYDFILPFKSRDLDSFSRLFIQCQFYAGDAGSVSHKNIDQTDTARAFTKSKFPSALFVEYIDGAGYFSSLKGDLVNLLSKSTTHDFFQVRTAPVKLRRCLQEIGYLTPLEISHLILGGYNSRSEIEHQLILQGYDYAEIDLALTAAIDNGFLIQKSDTVDIASGFLAFARRYCLLDCLAIYGKPISSDKLSGNLLVAGFGANHGMPQNELIKCSKKHLPSLSSKWASVDQAFDDIQWLMDERFIIGR